MLIYLTNKLERKHKHIVMESTITQEIQRSYQSNFMYFGLNGKTGRLKIHWEC